MYTQRVPPFLVLSLLLALICARPGRSESTSLFFLRPTEYSLSLEPLDSKSPDDLARTEKIGLLGARLDFLFDTGIYTGLGAYVSALGPRGGLILAGGDLGYRLSIWDRLVMKAEVFAGGGGGSRVPVGGGLMIRPAASIGLDLENFILTGGFAWVRFPNGNIDSKEPFVQIAIPSDFAYTNATGIVSPKGRHLISSHWGLAHWRIGPVLKGLYTKGKSNLRGDSLGAQAGLAGVAVDHDFTGDFFTRFQVHGAVSGQIAGFLSASLGGGYRFTLGDFLSLTPLVQIGTAGGSLVDTGGGLFTEPDLSLGIRLDGRTELELGLGYFTSITGSFRVPAVNAGVTTGFDGLDAQGRIRSAQASPGPPSNRPEWRLALSTERYFLAGRPNEKTGGVLQDIDLLGLGLEYRMSRRLFFSFNSYWPYNGGAGGYAVGLFGLGAVPVIFGPLSIELRAAGGAAGGGGIPAGGGAIGQISGGIDTALGGGFSLEADGGKLMIYRGLSAGFAEAGLRYAFGWPQPQISGQSRPGGS